MVTVIARNPEADKKTYFCYQPTYDKFVGDVLENPKHISNDYLVLSSPEWPGPYRVIPRRDIVTIDGNTEIHVETVKNDSWEVAGSKGKTYTVTLQSGTWTCTCPAFEFRRGECKHIIGKKNEQVRS